jgi:hypothetical protein
MEALFKIFLSVSPIIWILAFNGPIYSSVTTMLGYLSVRLRVRFQLFSIASITVLLDSEFWVCNTRYSIVNWLITDILQFQRFCLLTTFQFNFNFWSEGSSGRIGFFSRYGHCLSGTKFLLPRRLPSPAPVEWHNESLLMARIHNLFYFFLFLQELVLFHSATALPFSLSRCGRIQTPILARFFDLLA